MNKFDFENMERAIKTGRVLKELAKIELGLSDITKKFFINESQLEKVIEGCGINKITRAEIDFQKELLTDTQYLEAEKKVNDLLKAVENAEGKENEELKAKVLYHVEIRDNIYNNIQKKYLEA